MTTPVVELEAVRKSFVMPDGERADVLDVPAFALAEGEQCALEGTSGSGKSTLLHVISGIMRPDSGRVALDGIDVTRLAEARRDRLRADKLGLVFQQFNLLPGFTALENVLVAMSFGTGRPDRWRAADLLAEVGLSHRLHHRPSQLSIGQQQRVAVARALANRPRAVLADEPTKIHDPFRITGILARTGTPVDRGVYVNMEGFYLQDGHAKPPGADAPAAAAAPAPGLLPYAEREVTAILVETAALPGLPPELMAMELSRMLNEGRDAQAAMPVLEMRQLLDAFVRPLEVVLLLVTVLVVVVSAIGILVSMVGSALERSRDVAIMRALGAGRGTVLATVLVEAVLLAGLGGLAGWALGHGVVAAIAPWVADRAGVVVGFLSGSPAEFLLVPLLVGLAILAALIPALSAYRTDVARWL